MKCGFCFVWWVVLFFISLEEAVRGFAVMLPFESHV